jgi:hypothetical protein
VPQQRLPSSGRGGIENPTPTYQISTLANLLCSCMLGSIAASDHSAPLARGSSLGTSTSGPFVPWVTRVSHARLPQRPTSSPQFSSEHCSSAPAHFCICTGSQREECCPDNDTIAGHGSNDNSCPDTSRIYPCIKSRRRRPTATR